MMTSGMLVSSNRLVARWTAICKDRGQRLPSHYPNRLDVIPELDATLHFLGIGKRLFGILLGKSEQHVCRWFTQKDWGKQPSPVSLWRIQKLTRLKALGLLDIEYKALLAETKGLCKPNVGVCPLNNIGLLREDHPWKKYALDDGSIPHQHLPQYWGDKETDGRFDTNNFP